jgi:hypothetical protein
MLALFVLDCIWGFLSVLAFTGAQAQSAERKWSLINLIAVAVLLVLIIFGPRLLGGWDTEMKLCVFAVCLFRTIADYIACWTFYYPDVRAG